MSAFIDLSGMRFGKLTVVSLAGKLPSGIFKWNCLCDCGNTCVRGRKTLRKYEHSSCGCGTNQVGWETRRQRYGDFAKTKLQEYKIWNGMKQRCANPNHNKFENYGGRGIKVCARWLDDFTNFYVDMGPMPTSDHSIDRIDVNGDYRPDNCKWSTWDEQCRNKRITNPYGISGVYYDKSRNKFRSTININGKSKTIGRFDTVEEAIKARIEAEKKYWEKTS